MSEIEIADPRAEQAEEFIELIVCRGCVYKPGQDVSPGDVITVPVKRMHEGVFPARWWIDRRKACQTEEQFEEWTSINYDGRQGGPAAMADGPAELTEA